MESRNCAVVVDGSATARVRRLVTLCFYVEHCSWRARPDTAGGISLCLADSSPLACFARLFFKARGWRTVAALYVMFGDRRLRLTMLGRV